MVIKKSDLEEFKSELLVKSNTVYFSPSLRQAPGRTEWTSQEVVEELMDTMLSIRYSKTKSYGDRRFNQLRSDQLEKAMFFCDLQRKMDRLEAIIFDNDQSTTEDIIDAVSDIVGYGMMSLETVFYLWLRQQSEKKEI